MRSATCVRIASDHLGTQPRAADDRPNRHFAECTRLNVTNAVEQVGFDRPNLTQFHVIGWNLLLTETDTCHKTSLIKINSFRSVNVHLAVRETRLSTTLALGTGSTACFQLRPLPTVTLLIRFWSSAVLTNAARSPSLTLKLISTTLSLISFAENQGDMHRRWSLFYI